jgi:predicted AlkP superfamily phosphohydrolase/phosphomutase
MVALLGITFAFVAGCKGCGRDGAAKPATGTGKTPGTIATLRALRPQQGRVVILGFDGVDPDWLERWVKAGKLPTLAKLSAAHGGKAYKPLRSTNPPQSPVAWTTFATGTEPGEHGIYDFIARALGSDALPVLPTIATTSFEVQAAGPPVARNLRTGEPFWQLLGNAGVRVVALHVPYSFPPDPMRDGRMLSGLGVPDLRETNSTFTYAGTEVSEDQVAHPPGGGAMVRLKLEGGVARFDLEGPSVPGGDGARMKLAVELTPDAAAATAALRVDGKSAVLTVGKPSDWLELGFVHEGTRVVGIARFLLLETGKRTRLFVTPINMHPRQPYSPISYPGALSGQIADELKGLYKTVGWDHDTSALNAEVIDEAAFLEDVDTTERQRVQMLQQRLDKDDWDLLIWVSTATDRVAHMFYRLTDPEHPRYEPALAARHGNAIEAEYVRMDATVAAVLPKLRAEDTLLILSDHGFHGYNRGLHVNQWLRAQGLLALKNGAQSSSRDFFQDVEWSQTKAYALGTGQVYLNRQGREAGGVVSEQDAPAIVRQIRDGLLALRDTERKDAQVVREVYIGEQAFRGARERDRPDLQVAFAEGYRTSWETILGGVPAGTFADNTKKWSGDHAASDVADTDGILIANVPIAGERPAIVDIAPTVLKLFGKPVPAQYSGKDVLHEAAP